MQYLIYSRGPARYISMYDAYLVQYIHRPRNLVFLKQKKNRKKCVQPVLKYSRAKDNRHNVSMQKQHRINPSMVVTEVTELSVGATGTEEEHRLFIDRTVLSRLEKENNLRMCVWFGKKYAFCKPVDVKQIIFKADLLASKKHSKHILGSRC